MEKKDNRILAIASREVVTAEACYHRTCYKGYTRAEASPLGLPMAVMKAEKMSMLISTQKLTRCLHQMLTSDDYIR